MLRLEQRLQQQYPQWFRGHRARLARPLLRTLGRWSRFDDINGFLAGNGHLRGFAFLDAVAGHLRLDYSIDAQQLASIPASGRLLVVANHPSGALDALALLQALGRVRRDVRIVANDMLALIEPWTGCYCRCASSWTTGRRQPARGRAGVEAEHAWWCSRQAKSRGWACTECVTRAGARDSCASRATPARRCCRCGSPRAIRHCFMARLPCSSPRRPHCSPAKCMRAGRNHCGCMSAACCTSIRDANPPLRCATCVRPSMRSAPAADGRLDRNPWPRRSIPRRWSWPSPRPNCWAQPLTASRSAWRV